MRIIRRHVNLYSIVVKKESHLRLCKSVFIYLFFQNDISPLKSTEFIYQFITNGDSPNTQYFKKKPKMCEE